MPRFASPTISENEFDISNALTNGHEEDQSSDEDFGVHIPDSIDPDGLADLLNGEDQDDGDEAFIAGAQAGANRKSSNLKGKTVKKGGGFQAMGLDAPLLRAIARKGFSVPTPIQRKTIPLLLDQQDVVGMARTGSGKTAAFVIPMIQRLKAHSAKVGARAAILSPSRELALQTLKVVKELGKGTDLRTVLLVGGDNLEDQFGAMTGNPDIIIATPGRFLHLKVEMGLDLSSISYVVFDEADRLFEMGFATQLAEILHGLPPSRQTLLFSATLPKSLVEFARAGLEDPKLVRLDAESKISPDLESAFFGVKTAEKEGALLHIIQDVIKIPLKTEAQAKAMVNGESDFNPKKRKRPQQPTHIHDAPTAHSTIIFASTKHHVEYLATLLRSSGYAVSYVYGSLDQTARKMQVENFRLGISNILVVTDVAARGIDIPVLANVINYDFPSQPKIFIHRVGRTARAGRKGWSYSLVRDSDVPYMLDLQLFLSRRLIIGRSVEAGYSFAEDVILGSLQREKVESCSEWITKLLDENVDLDALRIVATKGEKLYMRTRNAASAESAKRSKGILADPHLAELNLLFSNESNRKQLQREDMLARVSGFRPQETIFEIGRRGTGAETADLIRKVRGKLEPHRVRALSGQATERNSEPKTANGHAEAASDDEEVGDLDQAAVDMDSASEDELEVTFSQPNDSGKGAKSKGNSGWQDSEHFMTYTPRESNLAEERGYGVHSGGNNVTRSGSGHFVLQAQGATMDLTNDESKGFGEATRPRGLRWDKKSKKYVARANDEDGSRGKKMVRGESGQKIAASFRSGRFDAWKKSNRIDRMPRVGELESHSNMAGGGGQGPGGKRYRHKSEQAPKAADKFRDDYFKRKKRVEAAKEKRVGIFKDGSGKNEVRDAEGVRKVRKVQEKRREKNARPTKRRRT